MFPSEALLHQPLFLRRMQVNKAPAASEEKNKRKKEKKSLPYITARIPHSQIPIPITTDQNDVVALAWGNSPMTFGWWGLTPVPKS